MKAIARHRVGVIFGPVGDLNKIVTSFLLLQLNTQQSAIEFELLPPPPDDPLWPLLGSRHPIVRSVAEECAASFATRYGHFWSCLLERSIASEQVPPRIIVVSMARFATTCTHNCRWPLDSRTRNWQRYMAPPSLVEFVIFLVLRLAMGLIEPRLREASTFERQPSRKLDDYSSRKPPSSGLGCESRSSEPTLIKGGQATFSE